MKCGKMKESKKDDEDIVMEGAREAHTYKAVGKTTLKNRHFSQDLKEVKGELFQTDVTPVNTIRRPI